MDPDTQHKLDLLRLLIRNAGSAIVAYSGGVDSALVAYLASNELGNNALAGIGTSPSYPQRELQRAIQLADDLRIPYRVIETEEHLIPDYAANEADRCYHCKSELYDRLRALAEAEGFQTIMDGSNASDLGDDRPGMTAASEAQVISPLLEAGITKDEVRAIAHHLGLPVWDKPEMACLSSRVPRGTPVSVGLLQRIEAAEDALEGMGFTQYRVRDHGSVARIELPHQDIARALQFRSQIVTQLQQLGYKHITLDLAGFRNSGITIPTASTAPTASEDHPG